MSGFGQLPLAYLAALTPECQVAISSGNVQAMSACICPQAGYVTNEECSAAVIAEGEASQKRVVMVGGAVAIVAAVAGYFAGTR